MSFTGEAGGPPAKCGPPLSDITAGLLARAAETAVQISCGSHGVSVIIVPSGKFSCSNCNGCGSACVGPSSPVLSPACAQTRKKGLYGSPWISFLALPPIACSRAATWPSAAMNDSIFGTLTSWFTSWSST